ncbi:MAG: glycerol-3-phosphate 1-O-acyltransferase PlsY [Dehalococcoidia bacterium]
MNWDIPLNAVFGYLLGSIPFGLVVGYLWTGKDIRTVGSGKTGATNVLRTAGRLPAALVVVADIAKGSAPALAGRFVFESDAAAAVGASAAIAGHVWPVFAGFRGGRGVATAFGGILGLAPLVSLLFPVIAAIIIIPTRYVSLMSVVGTPLCAAIIVVGGAMGWWAPEWGWYAAFAAAVVVYMHVPNIRRLLAGTEPKLGRGGTSPATG